VYGRPPLYTVLHNSDLTFDPLFWKLAQPLHLRGERSHRSRFLCSFSVFFCFCLPADSWMDGQTIRAINQSVMS